MSVPLRTVSRGTGAVRRARLLVVPSHDAGQTRIRVVLPPGLSFADGKGAMRLGIGDSNSNEIPSAEAQHTRIVWTGRARRGQPIEIVLFFTAPPGPTAVRVAQEAPVSRALPEQERKSVRGPAWKTINEQTVTVTIR